MDIGQEINNHLEWIDTIASLLGNENLTDDDFDEIGQHDKCRLGEWLNSEASDAYRGFPEFHKLIASHETFHHLAGKMIAALSSGDEDEAVKLQEQFIGMSHEVIGHLQMLQEMTDRE